MQTLIAVKATHQRWEAHRKGFCKKWGMGVYPYVGMSHIDISSILVTEFLPVAHRRIRRGPHLSRCTLAFDDLVLAANAEEDLCLQVGLM